MNELQLDQIQRYFDETTGHPLHLCFDKYEVEIEGIKVLLEDVPLLKDEITDSIFYPDQTKHIIAHFLEDAKKMGELQAHICRRINPSTQYTYAKKYDFLYSHIDYDFIPGLTRPVNEGFLTPVFFNIAVLNKYSQHPEYKLDLFSRTYGTIWHGTEWTMDFGINRNKKVIMWLGDIDQLPESEIYYLRSENVESDHDIHSEFYNAHIEVKFAKSSPQNKLIRERRTLNESVKSSYGWELFQLEGEVSKVIENLDTPVFWDDKHVSPAVESLNRIMVESINNASLKADLSQINPNLKTKDLASLKTLEYWLTERHSISNAKDLMCPLFVLNDFRILTCHLLPENKKQKSIRSINQRLGITESNLNNEIIYSTLIDKLVDSVIKIIREI
jgi:hypothetical protein